MATLTDQVGRVLGGRYRLDAGIGTGASAHVYRGYDTRLGRVVALKVLHPGLADDEGFLRRFRGEAQAVATLSHPNLVRLFDWGWEGGEPFLVLEYLSGGSLRQILDDGHRLSVAQAAAAGAAAARGLAHAHRRGLLHRDLKPSNLLFDEDGEVRIADFGLAKALADAAWTEPSGTLLGTARYASPEQAQGRPLDGRSDVYSLALVLYEAVTGDTPFRADSPLATLAARIGASLPPAAALGDLYPVLAQATIAEPLARLSAADLALELGLLTDQLGRPEPLPLRHEVAVPDPEPVRLGATDPPTELAPARVAPAPRQPRRRARRRRRSRRRLAIGLGVGVVLLGAAAAAGAVWYVHDVVYSHVVPNLPGFALGQATTRLNAAGLSGRVATRTYDPSVPAGHVLSASPSAGSRLRRGSAVALAVSKGPAPVAVPVEIGATSSVATAEVTSAHLVPRTTHRYSETVPVGVVLAERPAKGSELPGQGVVLVVSLGPTPRTIPDLAGDSWATARADLSALRLVPGEQQAYSTSVTAGEVISTSPASGATGVAVGSSVEVVISKGPQLVAVPNVAGQTITNAVATLRAAGLNVTEVVGPPFATQATTTDPAPGAEVAPGSSLTLYSA